MAAVGDLSAENKPGIFMPPTADDTSVQFTAVALDKKKKTPRRILHFSDGILEEYSTDEEEDTTPEQPLVDPKTLTWMPWMVYYMSTVAYKAWSIADLCGEKLAWFFGITSPKYQSAIDEYYRRKEEEEHEKAEKEKQDGEARGLSAIDVSIVEEKQMAGENLDKY